jgi:WD40 repeat protein
MVPFLRQQRSSLLLCVAVATLGGTGSLSAGAVDRFGDPLPAGAMARMGTVRWGHDDIVTFVAFTADGKGVITASRDNALRYWNRETGMERYRIESFVRRPGGAPRDAHVIEVGGRRLGAATLSPDGKTLAAVFDYTRIYLWDVPTGREIRQLTSPVNVYALAFSPNGKWLALNGTSSAVRVIDANTGKPLHEPMAVPVGKRASSSFGTAGFTFSPDSRFLAEVIPASAFGLVNPSEAFVRITDLETNNEVARIEGEKRAGRMPIAYSRDGKLVAFTSGMKLYLCDVAAGKEIRQFDIKATATALAFTQDGKTIATKGIHSAIRLFNAETGEFKERLGQPMPAAYSVASRSFKSTTIISDDADLAISPDGKIIACGASQTVRFWDLASFKELPVGLGGAGKTEKPLSAGHRGPVYAVAATPDGKTLLSWGIDQTLRRWDAANGRELAAFPVPGYTSRVVFPADRGFAALLVQDMIHKIDVGTGKEIFKVKGHEKGADALAVSADGKLLASGGATDGTIRIYDAADGKMLRQIMTFAEGDRRSTPISALAFGNMSSGTQVLAAQVMSATRSQSAIVLWDALTGQELHRINSSFAATQIAFAPDGRLLATGNSDSSVSVWEIASGRERVRIDRDRVRNDDGGGDVLFSSKKKSSILGTMDSYMPAPSTLVFSPDGNVLAEVGRDRVVRAWDLWNGREIGPLAGHQGIVNALGFAPNGKTLYSGSNDATILAWNLPHPRHASVPAGEIAAKELEFLWTDLAADDAVNAYRSIRKLASASAQTAAFLRNRLTPVAHVDVKKIEQLIRDLESVNYPTRIRATTELAALGELAMPAMNKAFANPSSLETKRRLQPLLQKLTTGTLTPDQLRVVRAIEVLERMASAEARQQLASLAKGAPGALPTRQAQAALDRISLARVGE